MGKISSIIVTLVFVGAIALLVYFCFRAKKKRQLGGHRWSDVFFRQNQDQQCNGNQVQNQSQGYDGSQMAAIGYSQQPNSHVPHSVVSPYAQPYPGQHGNYPASGPPYPTPYPIGHPPNMPMPGGQFEHIQHQQTSPPAITYPYPPGPHDLPPPYSAVVAADQQHVQRY